MKSVSRLDAISNKAAAGRRLALAIGAVAVIFGLTTGSALAEDLSSGEPPPDEPACTTVYGCTVEVRPIVSGGYVVHATFNRPAGKVPDLTTDTEIRIDGRWVDRVNSTMALIDYHCCCPRELAGEVALVFDAGELIGGSMVEVDFGGGTTGAQLCYGLVPSTPTVNGATRGRATGAVRSESIRIGVVAAGADVQRRAD